MLMSIFSFIFSLTKLNFINFPYLFLDSIYMLGFNYY